MFNSLFGGMVPTQNPLDVERTLAMRRSVLDYVKEDVATLGTRLAAADKRKMSNHLDALRQLELALTPGATLNCSATGTLGSRATASPSATRDVGYSTALSSSTCNGAGGRCADGQAAAIMLRSELELRIDLITAAFACGLRHSATLMCQPANGGINPFGGGFGNHHDVSHLGVFLPSNPGSSLTARAVRADIDAWYGQRFAYLLKRLTDLQLIDTTVVPWVSEIAEGHQGENFTVPVAGGGALGLQHGKLYTDGGTLPKFTLSQIWVSILKAMGTNKDTFGPESTGGAPGFYKAV
jgi:hypothetical protein